MVGLANQTAPEMDLFISDAIRNTLFTNRQGRPEDLVARNIQRGRDHGIPGYDKLRRVCGLADIVGREAPAEINAEDWAKLMKTYNNDPSQIDSFTAGLAETAPSDGMVSFSISFQFCILSLPKVGPLFACIIKRQFEKLRDGDRFFFSHRRGGPSRSQGLHPIAKRNIQERSLGGIFCDNLEATVLESTVFPKTVGSEVFRTPNPKTNPKLNCKKLKPGNGRLDLPRIFDEALIQRSSDPGLSEILKKDVVVEVLDERIVQSVNHPSEYFNNLNETTKLEVDEGYVIELTFEVFQLEIDSNCYDFVEIFDEKRLYHKLCGGDAVNKYTKYTSGGNELTVRFHSDRSVTAAGFRASWKEVEA